MYSPTSLSQVTRVSGAPGTCPLPSATCRFSGLGQYFSTRGDRALYEENAWSRHNFYIWEMKKNLRSLHHKVQKRHGIFYHFKQAMNF